MSSKSISWQEFYDFAVHENGDSRTADWPLVYYPLVPFCTILSYTLFCVYAKDLTKGLPIFDLKPVILFYNFFMTLLNLYMTFEFFIVAWKESYSLTCQPVDYSYSKNALRMASVCWVYYASKYAELVETLIFALRKKYNQISFLHVYHHTTMLALWWSVSKWIPGGQAFLFGGLNSFVHVVMYVYYGLSALGPAVRKYLWWKKYITILQLSQFVILFFFCIQNVYRKCDFSRAVVIANVAYSLSLLVLFLNFYANAYMKPKVYSFANSGAKKVELVSKAKLGKKIK